METIIGRTRKDGSKAFTAQIVIKKAGAIVRESANQLAKGRHRLGDTQRTPEHLTNDQTRRSSGLSVVLVRRAVCHPVLRISKPGRMRNVVHHRDEPAACRIAHETQTGQIPQRLCQW